MSLAPRGHREVFGRAGLEIIRTIGDCQLAIANWPLATDAMENQQLEIGNVNGRSGTVPSGGDRCSTVATALTN